jgi:hypothetical protein
MNERISLFDLTALRFELCLHKRHVFLAYPSSEAHYNTEEEYLSKCSLGPLPLSHFGAPSHGFLRHYITLIWLDNALTHSHQLPFNI